MENRRDVDTSSRSNPELQPTKAQKAARKAAFTRRENEKRRKMADESQDNHVILAHPVNPEMVSMTKEELDTALENAKVQGIQQEKKKQLEEKASDSTCAICHGLFGRPKIIDCGHEFCQECIGNLPAGGGSYFQCPTCKQELFNPKSTMEDYAASRPCARRAANSARELMLNNNDPHDVVKVLGLSLGSLSRTEFERFCKTLENPANKVDCGPSVVKAICEVKRFNEALTILSTITSTYDDVLRAALDKLSSLTEHDGVMSPFVAEEIREHLLKLHNSFEDRLHEVYHRAPLQAQD